MYLKIGLSDNRQYYIEQYKNLSSTDTELTLKYDTSAHSSRYFHKLTISIQEIPFRVTTLSIAAVSLRGFNDYELDYFISIIPKHITTLKLGGQELLTKSRLSIDRSIIPKPSLDIWPKRIPASVKSLDLSDNNLDIGMQVPVTLSLLTLFCNNLTHTITTLTLSAHNLPKELTAAQLKELLPGVKNLIVTDWNGKPILEHPCAFHRVQASPEPEKPEAKPPVVEKHDEFHQDTANKDSRALLHETLLFFMNVANIASIGVAAIGVCMLALTPFVVAGAVVATIGVACYAGSFFAAQRLDPRDTDNAAPVYH